MQRDDIQRLLQNQPAGGLYVDTPNFSGGVSGIQLNDQTSVEEQLALLSGFAKISGAKSRRFGQCLLMDQRAGVAIPVSMALQESSIKQLSGTSYSRVIAKNCGPSSRFYVQGGWKNIAEVYGTAGLSAVINSKTFNNSVASMLNSSSPVRLLVEKGAAPLQSGGSECGVAIIGGAKGREAFRPVIDSVIELTRTMFAPSIKSQMLAGSKPEDIIRTETARHGVGILAGAIAAAELMSSSPEIRPAILRAYPEINSQVIARAVELERSTGAEIVRNPQLFELESHKEGVRQLDADRECAAPDMSA